ncbi:pilus assembly protein N-terminal domain-containing protein [Sediminicoccus sp. KRV36]|uniref:pilus assembly protein N-terminal domain-containing protein n=1 Tax=Sediminicoccus sp. KRV36 TaxID=3133721 RepID=UPI00200FE195|nr:pilus assembly protein N-terminal domain-containing protein [Sediminicoccus rosea]UPY38568.1 pilus assembly protein N-terminal domain-containing protein [Sediminicoccus rosea]
MPGTYTLPEITITGFSILNSVGLGCQNLPEDVKEVKWMLNNISVELGGAARTLNDEDGFARGPDFDKLVNAIKVFQLRHFKGQFTPDGQVQPNRATFRKLQELQGRRATGQQGDGIKVQPDTPIGGPCDTFGFSLARLDKTKPGPAGDWDRINPALPPVQMVPLGGTRTLNFLASSMVNGTLELESISDLKISNTNIAEIVSVSDGNVVVKGTCPGRTTLTARDSRRRTLDVALDVRRLLSFKVDVYHLGAPRVRGALDMLANKIVFGLNSVYNSQANMMFTPGPNRVVVPSITIGGTARHVSADSRIVVHDPGEPFAIPRTPNDIVIQSSHLFALRRDALNLSVFVHERILSSKNLHHGGESWIGSRTSWFRILPDIAAINAASLLSHEAGHSLGLQHVTTPNNAGFLMHPNLPGNNIIIPAETLADLPGG